MHPVRNKIYWILLFLFVTTSCINAQTEWGIKDNSIFEEKVYDKDTSAAAVILCQTTKISFPDEVFNSLYVEYKVHKKIHVLRKDGFDAANITITCWRNIFPDLKAQTINPDGKGGQIITKLDKNLVFTEKANEWEDNFKFTFPNVQEGCVIEYEYVFRGGLSRYLGPWYFQSQYPIVYSQVDMRIPSFIYMKPIIENMDGKLVTKTAEDYYKGIETKYTAQNVPALKEDKFITTMDDYLPQLRYVVTGVNIPNSHALLSFAENWDDEVRDFMLYKKFVNSNFGLVEPIKYAKEQRKLPSEAERIKQVYNFVITNMKWNKEYSSVPDVLLVNGYKNHTANSATINLLLLEMLKAADIKADLLFLSTRKRGKIQVYYPEIHQFNHLMVVAEVDSQKYYLDAVNPLQPFNLINFDALNCVALKVSSPIAWEVPVAQRASSKTLITTIQLDSMATLNGKVNVAATDYDALAMRKELEGRTVKEYLDENMHKQDGVEWMDTKVENKDSIEKKLKLSFSFAPSLQADKAGDKTVYLKLFPVNFGTDNPLTEKNRKLPVNYGYTFEEAYKTTIMLPEQYKVSEAPKPMKLTLPDGSATYTFMLQYDENMVQVNGSFKVNKIEFAPAEYNDLKEIYARVSEAMNSTIVLEKK